MIAQHIGKSEDIMRTVKDVITSCTFEKVDAEKLPIFDLEYIFINQDYKVCR